MDALVNLLVENAPNLVGLALLAFVLWKQNTRLLDNLLERISTLEAEAARQTEQVQANTRQLEILIHRNPPKTTMTHVADSSDVRRRGGVGGYE